MSEYISGIEQRKQDKENKILKQQAEVELYIQNNLACIEDPTVLTNEVFEFQFNEIMLEIKSKFNGYRVFAHGNNYIINLLEGWVESRKCKIEIPRKLNLKHSPPHFRDMLWFEQNIQLCNIMQFLNQNILKKSDQDLDYKITMLFLSAVTNGGLNFSVGLLTLMNQLVSQEAPLNKLNETYFIDLEIDDKSFPITEVFEINGENGEVEKIELYIHRWIPDTTSLLWINNLLDQKYELSKKFNYQELNKMIINKLNNIANENQIEFKQIKNIKHICEVGVGITEFLPGVRLNQTLISYATGDFKSPSLPFSKLKTITEDHYIESKLKNDNYSLKKTHRMNNSAYSEILNILKETKGKLPSINKVKHGLSDLLDQYDTIVENSFISWLYHNLNDRRNGVRTLKNHMSYIGFAWLQATHEKLDVVNSEELSSFYSKIIDYREIHNKPTVNEFTRSLKLFHEYCEDREIFSEVDNFDNLSTSRKFSRTGFITEKLFKKFLFNIVKNSDFKYMMSCFFIILYRSGLRYQEVRCLKICDVELSDDLYVLNRKNPKKTLKSYSAERKIPLGILLKEEEKKILLQYIKNKTNKNNVTQNSMLFSHDNTPNQPIGTQIPSSTFKKYLKKKYDLPFVIHHMRHTALSRLHFILENNDILSKQFTDYDEAQLSKIRARLNSEKKNSFWSLSSYAGHAEPKMTFTHYLHFTDFILHSTLSKNSSTLSFDSIQLMSGLSRQYLNRNLNAKASENHFFKLPEINQALSNKLDNHCDSSSDLAFIKNTNEEEFEIKYIVSPYEIFLMLKQVESGIPLEKVAIDSEIETDVLKHYFNNAVSLANLANQKKFPKLFTSSCVKDAKLKPLVPREPSSSIERNACNRLLAEFMKYFNHDPQDCKKIVLYCLDNISNSGIVFSNPDDLDLLLNIISPVLSKKSMLIKYRLAEKVEIKNQVPLWRSAIDKRAILDFTTGKDNNKISKTNLYPKGQAILETRHPQEKYKVEASQNTDKKISQLNSNLFRFVVHLLAIFILDLPDDYINNT